MSVISSAKTSAGIPVYVQKIPGSKRAGFMTVIKTGSRDEKENEAGLSHLLEHTVFRATKTKTSFQMSKEIEGAGGMTNAFTSKENTAFYAVTLAETKNVAKNLISDIMVNTLLKDSDTELEKKIVLQELSMCENSPDDYIHDVFDHVIWEGNNLSKDIIGTKESIKSFTDKDIRRYYEEKYKAPNLGVFAAGDVDIQEVVSWAEENFDGLGKTKANVRKAPTGFKTGYYHLKRKEDNCYIKLGFRGLPAGDKNIFVQDLLVATLGTGSSSRFFNKVREEKALVYAIFNMTDRFVDASSASTVFFATENNVLETLETIAKTIRDFKANGFDKGELERSKNIMKGSIVSAAESTKSTMELLARSTGYFGKPLSQDDRLNAVNAVTEEDIMKMAEKILVPENLSIAMLADEVPKMKGFKVSDLDF